MARRALEAKGDVVYWRGEVPEDAPANQVEDVYDQQQGPPALDWSKIPPALQLEDPEPSAPAVACVFGGAMAASVDSLALIAARQAALHRITEVASPLWESCLASGAVEP